MINYTTRFYSIVVLIKVLKFLSFNTDKISNSYIVMHQMFSAYTKCLSELINV